MLINKKLGAAAQRGTQLVMLPWNLAHGGSTLPALVERLARFSERGAAGITPVLFPYNVTYGVLDPLAQVLHRHVLLRQLNVNGTAPFLLLSQTPALLA